MKVTRPAILMQEIVLSVEQAFNIHGDIPRLTAQLAEAVMDKLSPLTRQFIHPVYLSVTTVLARSFTRNHVIGVYAELTGGVSVIYPPDHKTFHNPGRDLYDALIR